MFRLRDLKNWTYQIHKSNGPAYEGTPLSIFNEAVKMGVNQRELLQAVHILTKSNHDYADFNDYGRLTKTKRNGE